MELGDKSNRRNREQFDVDNADETIIRMCMQKSQRILNPIIDWDEGDVWEFLKTNNIPYCKLYDQGYKRLGCIGCPMAPANKRKEDFERYPKFKQAYIRAFDRMIERLKTKREQTPTRWTSGEDVMSWWIK